MKKKGVLLAAVAAAAVLLTSCKGGQQGLPTSNEYPVVTIGAANAQLKTTYPATIKGVQDVEVRPRLAVLLQNCMYMKVSMFMLVRCYL